MYTDNSKYLFEYVNEYEENVRAVWVSQKPEIVNNLKKEGYEAYTFNSLRGTFVSMKAAVNIQTGTRADVNSFCLGGSKTIQLWHGIPIRKIGRDNSLFEFKSRENKKTKILKATRYYGTNNYSSNYWLLASDVQCDRIFSAFQTRPERMYVTGQPRDDAFNLNKRNLAIDKLRSNGIKKIIVYLPTHRNYGETGETIPKSELDYLDEELRKHNYAMIYKPHYYEVQRLKKQRMLFTNIVLEDNIGLSNDIYSYIPSCDLLISDYSSVCYDYLFAKKPIIHYAYDLDSYTANSEGFYEKYENCVVGPICKNVFQLCREMVSLLEVDTTEQIRNKALQKYYNYYDSNNSMRAVETIKQILSRETNNRYSWKQNDK